MKRMTVLGLAGVLAAAAVGCESPGHNPEVRRELTTAALAKYPGNPRAPETFKLAAVDAPARKSLELLNLTDTPVPAGKLWVNGRFVRTVPTIPARGVTSVDYADLLEAGPGLSDLKQADAAVTRIEYQTDTALFTVDGPARR